MKHFTFFAFVIVFNFCYSAFAAEVDSTDTPNSIVYEKLYLHVDRELYAPGDNIWFKSYLVSGINNKLVPGYKNIYVQLISESGEPVEKRLLLSKDGTAHGDILLSENIADGTYTIRAFTKYLANFGEESFFHRKIEISGSKNSFELEKDNLSENPSKIDVAFLPEGGNFVLNAINHIAFKAINEEGKGVKAKGKVVDETGAEVVSFRTSYKGMGKFIMMPQEGKSYFVLIDDHPEFNYQFEPANPDGISLSYKPDGNYLQFTLTRNLKITQPQSFVLKASHKGMELFNSRITMNEFQHAQRLYKGLFPRGMSKITVSDTYNNIVAERMVFIRNNTEKSLELDINKEDFTTREGVRIDVSSLLDKTDTIVSNLSVSVVHEDYLSNSGNTQTIESYLLLDSELKGAIESPASYFFDEQNITADEKLDLVMMVNGWRSYYWDDLEEYRGIDLPNWDDYGLTLEGNVVKQWGKKPVENGKVVIGPFSNSFLFIESKTDEQGYFKFDRMYLKDNAKIMINAETKSGNKRNDIILAPQHSLDMPISAEKLDQCCFDIDIPFKFYRENYYRLQAEKEYEVKTGILLGEVQAIGSKKIGDGHFRLYGRADVSMTVLDEDIETYFTILDYLEGRVAGVVVVGEEVRIRGAARNPLLLVDGVESYWTDMSTIPMGDVDKVEVLKSAYSTSIFGSRGGDGVISILTKMGKGEWENSWQRNIHGRITPTVFGFQQAREFYSPKYSMENINDAKPDKRPTLFWNPDVEVIDGRASINFFTADNYARYKVMVEGISKTGKICSGFADFAVSIPRN